MSGLTRGPGRDMGPEFNALVNATELSRRAPESGLLANCPGARRSTLSHGVSGGPGSSPLHRPLVHEAPEVLGPMTRSSPTQSNEAPTDVSLGRNANVFPKAATLQVLPSEVWLNLLL